MQRILQPGQADQTINKSRFIAWAEYCADERAISTMLRRMATEHAHAHHLAYAFRVKTPQGIVQRFHDLHRQLQGLREELASLRERLPRA